MFLCTPYDISAGTPQFDREGIGKDCLAGTVHSVALTLTKSGRSGTRW